MELLRERERERDGYMPLLFNAMALNQHFNPLFIIIFFFEGYWKKETKGRKKHYLALDVEGDEDLNEGYIFTFIVHLFFTGNHTF